MANIPGATNVLPGVFTDVVTQSRGAAIPGGTRLVAMIGEGSTDEVIVSQAIGGGKDGLNSSYTSSTGAQGRYFKLSNANLIPKRTTLYKNGIPLIGLESLIDSNSFNSKYDYRIDPVTGQIELQKAYIVDQGYANGIKYVPSDSNVGDAAINNLELTDTNAPPETWTVRCVSVQRGPGDTPILGTAKFIAFGSISGARLDANGNPVIWKANGIAVDNKIIKFSISETLVSSVPGDSFSIKVDSGVLVRNDTLTANYIAESTLNDPVLLQGLQDVVDRHGAPSITNNLSLGAQLAFANGAPALITVQAKPSIPTRRSYILAEKVDNPDNFDPDTFDQDDYIFPLPLGVTPYVNAEIHIFATNLAKEETQLLPNKYEFYSLGTTGHPSIRDFIKSDLSVPSGYSYSYTVIEQAATIATGFDGVIKRDTNYTDIGQFSVPNVTFNSEYVGKTLKIIDSNNQANIGTYDITGVTEGKLSITLTETSGRSANAPTVNFPDFENDPSDVAFQIIDVSTELPIGAVIDGYITKSVGTATATLGCPSTSFDFGTISSLYTRRVKINSGSIGNYNNGLYDIISASYDSLLNTIEIEMVLVDETSMRYEIIDTSDVTNYLVLNHNIVPDQNQLRVTIVDYKEADFYDAGWINALETLETIECDIVVPLPSQTISGIFQNTLAHCKVMSNIRNKKERVMFAGAIKGLTPDNLTGAKEAAVEDIGVLEGIQGENINDILTEDRANYSVPNAFGNTFRCVYFYPDEIIVQAGADNLSVDGFYIAAAAAGYAAAEPRVETPFTNKVLSGFTILRSKQFSTLTLENLAAAGVTTLQPVAGGGRIIWGLTTTQSGYPEEQEISVVFIRDRVAKILRAGFAGYIGLAETPETAIVLDTRATILLNALVSQRLITAYADLNVVRDSADPRQWNISVKIQPTYPINFIYIKVAVGVI